MTPAFESTAPPSARSWRRVVAYLGLGWGLIELGVAMWEEISAFNLKPYHSTEVFLFVVFLGLSMIGMTVGLPTSLLLTRRRVYSSSYLLAALCPALWVLFCLLVVTIGIEGDRRFWEFYLASGLVRLALVFALVSAARRPAG